MRREYDLDEILAEYSDPATEYGEPETEEPANAQDKPTETEEEDGDPELQNIHEPSDEPGNSEEDEESRAYDERSENKDGAPASEDSGLTQVFTLRDVEEIKNRERKNRTDSQRDISFESEADSGARPRKKKKVRKESFGTRLGLGLLSLIFAIISLAALIWSLQNLHPDTSAAADVSQTKGSTNLVDRLDTVLNNAKANALSDIAYIPKHYTIPEHDTVAPKPREGNFGSVSPANAEDVMAVIEQAQNSGLLEGQETVFSPYLNFRSDTNIQYYCDDTILTILWKEIIDGNTVTCCEVKVADASQFRRKIVDDTFGSSNKLFATSLAASVNAVVAMNADFYMFRDFGIVAYDRDLKRFSEATYTGNYKKYNCTDTLFITDQGDFLFWHRLQEATPEQMQAYIDENNIVFSIAFGPILVEDGQLQVCDWYPAGEIDKGYSRAGIGQKDHLHYFYMSLNHSAEMEARWTVNRFGEKMYERGLQQAYCLDGGQTSEIVWRGAPFNYIDYGAEREVSDIIYFATAIPETEGTP